MMSKTQLSFEQENLEDGKSSLRSKENESISQDNNLKLTNEENMKSKLKITNKIFTSKSFTPKEVIKVNYYIPYEEPKVSIEDFQRIGWKIPKNSTWIEEQEKHNEFLERHELFKPCIWLIPKEFWYVPDNLIDSLGYPIMALLPDLYAYLWNMYNMFFTPEGFWATNSETVMMTLGELWTHAEWRDRAIAKEKTELESFHNQQDGDYDRIYEEGFSIDDLSFYEEKKNTGPLKNRNKQVLQKHNTNKPKPKPKPIFIERPAKPIEIEKDEGFLEEWEIKVSRDVVEVDESREPSSLVFIGHVDSGKSTICGNLMYLTGMVDEWTINKFKKEAQENNRDSWWLAYVMDSNESERAKGKTVEVGRATLETKTKRYTIFDAPGHKNYVPNMIMGAAMADTAALVISARKGEYETGFIGDGQTKEHAHLAKSLGVNKLIIVVNKMDEETVQWSEERYWKNWNYRHILYYFFILDRL